MASHAASGSPDAPTPFSLVELASDAQRRWASEYARTHRLKRSMSWLIAIALTAYVGFYVFELGIHDIIYVRLIFTFATIYLPLSLIGMAAGYGLKGDRLLSVWAVAWVFLIFDGSLSIQIFNSGKNIAGALYLIATLGIGGILCYGLHIPLDPSIDWDAVHAERLLDAQTARGGHCYKKIITDYRKAEEIAASWLRRLGYRDAHATPDRPDDGIDVESLGAVAQVKYWTTKRVGIAEVQRLAGSAERGQACFFFAACGYTKAAFRWAASHDHRVSLFIIRPDGNIFACNYLARRALWGAPRHLPVALRRPLTSRYVISVSLCMFLFSIIFAYLAIYTASVGDSLGALLHGFMAICTFAIAAGLAGRPIARVVKNVKNNKPLDIRKSFTREVSREDEGLPSDDFVGYEQDPVLRLFSIIFDLGVQCRTIGRVIRARMR